MDAERVVVLLVEDEDGHAELVRRAFEPVDDAIELVVAGSLDEARRFLSTTTPSLVVADLRLPDGDGLALLECPGARERYPVVAMTRYGDEATARESMRAGAIDYIIKSADALADLPHLVERIMREWQLVQARQESDLALRGSEQRYRELFEKAHDGIAIADPDTGIILDCNAALCALVGRPREALIGRHQSVLHPADEPMGERHSAKFEYHVHVDATAPVEMRVVRPNGEVRDVEISAGFVAVGERRALQGIFRDITDRRRTQGELEQALLFSRQVIASAGNGIAVTDRDLRCRVWNPALARLTGIPAADAVGRTPAEMFPDPGDRWIEDLVTRALRGETVESGERPVKPSGGGEGSWVSVTMSPHRDTRGAVIGAIASVTDVSAHRDAERRLEAAQTSLQRFFDVTPDLLCVAHTDGTFREVNAAWERALGYTVDELLSRPSLELIHPDDRERTLAEGARQAAGEIMEDFENRYRCKDGTSRWLSWRTTPADADGFLYAAGRDVTDRKQREETLMWHLEVTSVLSRVRMGLADPSMTIQTLSRVVLDAAREITGSEYGYVAAVDPPTQDLLDHAIDGMTDACRSKPMPIRFSVGPDGTYGRLWGHALNTQQGFFTLSPATHPASRGIPVDHVMIDSFLTAPAILGDELVGQIALANGREDYTERHLVAVAQLADLYALAVQTHRARAALEESEERFRATFEQAAVGMAHSDPDGRLLRANDRLCEMLGRPREELLGLLFHDVSHPDDLQDDVEQRERVLSGEIESYSIEERYVRRDGSVMWGNKTVSLIRKPDGTPDHVISVVEDITQRKDAEKERAKLEAQLQRTQQLESLGVLAGGIAHDFNNILAGILGFTEIALDEVADDGSAASHLRQALSGAHRAKELVRQILAFSRQAPADRKPVLLTSLVRDSLGFVRASLPSTIDIRQHLEKALPPVHADATQIQQVILNLCANAEYAMRPAGGVLDVAVRAVTLDAAEAARLGCGGEGRYTVLCVGDTGPGMDQATRARIFDPFFTTKPPGEGTGLGLSTCYGIVAGHGGAISVYSEPGVGTTFSVYLPLAEQAAEAVEADETHIPTGRERVLFVDDEQAISSVAQTSLGALGYTAVVFTDSRLALEAFRADPSGFSLVLTDQTMPRMAGLDLIAEVRRLNADVPVVLMTGRLGGVPRETLQALGVGDVLAKPYSRRELAEAVRRALDG